MKKQRRRNKQHHPSSNGGQPAASTAAYKSQKSNNKARKKKPKQRSNHESIDDNDDNDDNDDDIIAQLQRQRLKSKAAAATATISADCSSPTSKDTKPPPSNPNVKRPAKHTAATASNCQGGDGGGFQYDPILKRYFPKSAFQSHGNNDICIQRIQKQITATNNDVDGDSSKNDEMLINDRAFHLKGNVTDHDVRRVIFRGIRLPTYECSNSGGMLSSMNSQSGKKRKTQRNNNNSNRHCSDQKLENSPSPSIPCTARTTFLLTTSLEYCTMTQRRSALASMLVPMSVAKTAKVVPNQSTLETLQNDTKRCMHSYIDKECLHDEPLGPFERSTTNHHRQQSRMGHSTVKGSSMGMQRRWFSMLPPIKSQRESQMYVKSLFFLHH